MSRPQSHSINRLNLDMHGLILETSIWLLAGSTRFLRSKLPAETAENPERLRMMKFTNWRIWTFVQTLRILLPMHCHSFQVTAWAELFRSQETETLRRMFYHSSQMRCEIKFLQKYKYKLPDSLLLRREANLKLHPETPLLVPKSGNCRSAIAVDFFNMKTYAEKMLRILQVETRYFSLHFFAASRFAGGLIVMWQSSDSIEKVIPTK